MNRDILGIDKGRILRFNGRICVTSDVEINKLIL